MPYSQERSDLYRIICLAVKLYVWSVMTAFSFQSRGIQEICFFLIKCQQRCSTIKKIILFFFRKYFSKGNDWVYSKSISLLPCIPKVRLTLYVMYIYYLYLYQSKIHNICIKWNKNTSITDLYHHYLTYSIGPFTYGGPVQHVFLDLLRKNN